MSNIKISGGDAVGLSPAANETSVAGARAPQAERDMFLTLLVTQLKNQDPLEPQDGAQFVAQLAQFNSLDQLIGIRQALDDLVETNRPANANTGGEASSSINPAAAKPRLNLF